MPTGRQNPHCAELGRVVRGVTHGYNEVVECSVPADSEHDVVNASEFLCSQLSQRISLRSGGQVGEWARGEFSLQERGSHPEACDLNGVLRWKVCLMLGALMAQCASYCLSFLCALSSRADASRQQETCMSGARHSIESLW